MASSNIKLLDENNNISPDFNETVEIVLKGIHGDKYYDVDEELQDTRAIATLKEEVKNVKNNTKKQKVSFKDFIPVLFFIIITILLCIGGYLFLNQFDPSSILGG